MNDIKSGMYRLEEDSFETDNTRPIESCEVEIVDSFKEDGERSIARDPDSLVSKSQSVQSPSHNSNSLSTNLENLEVAGFSGDSSTVNGDVEVVDSFQADGEEPIAKTPDFLINNRV